MTIESEVYDCLVADADVQGQIGNSDSPVTYRVYPTTAPDDVLRPYLVYFVVTGRQLSTLQALGTSGLSTLKNARIQISCFANTALAARTLADHVTDAMAKCSTFGVGDHTETTVYESTTRIHHIAVDFSIWN